VVQSDGGRGRRRKNALHEGNLPFYAEEGFTYRAVRGAEGGGGGEDDQSELGHGDNRALVLAGNGISLTITEWKSEMILWKFQKH